MLDFETEHGEAYTATRNPCKLCAPLGACLAFRGVEGCVPFLHGSQGCSTYIRRYLISHFKEPVDIASSNFGEASAVFGGRENLRTGLKNVVRQYQPKLIGIATTCLAETIGDDVAFYLREIRAEDGEALPATVHASTPSYAGTHVEGFHTAVRSLLAGLAERVEPHAGINVLPGMVSPADLRLLKAIVAGFGIEMTLLPDYSDTLDAPVWEEYQRISAGGTPPEAIRRMGGANATIEFNATSPSDTTPGAWLEESLGVKRRTLPLPIGVNLTDRFFRVLEELSGRPTPAHFHAERGRVVDSYVDAHKYVFGKRALVYGEPDLVVGLASLLSEIGMTAVICAPRSEASTLKEAIATIPIESVEEVLVLDGADFKEIEEHAMRLTPDIVLGSSKGYRFARKLEVPLVRVGFPIHDRIDGPRLLHLGYGGAQQLFDRITNALIEASQDRSPIGYSYM